MALRVIAARQLEDFRVARRGVSFPPALSLGQRVNHSLLGEESRGVAFPLREARFSLSLRERVRVRGNGAKFHPGYRSNHGTFELSESSGKGGGFPR